jgi:hypothetical protein
MLHCILLQELAYTIQQLEAQEAPGPALEAVQGMLGKLVASGVQQLAGHLHAVPAWLIAREGWQLSVTHSGSQPITMMPEQLQVGGWGRICVHCCVAMSLHCLGLCS